MSAATLTAGCSVASVADSVTGTLADRIAATLDGAGNLQASGLPEAFTYRALAVIAFKLGEREPTEAQHVQVRRAAGRLVRDGRAERDAERRLGTRGAVEVRRPMTPADQELREAATRPFRERMEARRQATPYPIDTGFGGVVDVPVEPVLIIRESGVEVRAGRVT